MAENVPLFKEKWLSARSLEADADSWADGVITTFDTGGESYLDSVRSLFERFPISRKQKRGLRVRLESFRNEDHLGAVNELVWWAFMQWAGMDPKPVPTGVGARPDFVVETPVAFFCEVSTLNRSDMEKFKLQAGEGIPLDHSETLRRTLAKLTDEKLAQMTYASDRKCPCVLVLFDYTTWSGFGTQFFRYLGDYLLGKSRGFRHLPPILSALVYVEKRAIDGRIGVSSERSAVYHNPCATFPLAIAAFSTLDQFKGEMVAVEAKKPDAWIFL